MCNRLSPVALIVFLSFSCSLAISADGQSPKSRFLQSQQSKDKITEEAPSLFPLTAKATIIWSKSSQSKDRGKEVIYLTSSETVLFAIQKRQRADVDSGTAKDPEIAEFFVYSAEQNFHARGRVHLPSQKVWVDHRSKGLSRKLPQTEGFLDVMLDTILEDSTTAENASMKLRFHALWYQFQVNQVAREFRNQQHGLFNLSQTIDGVSIQTTNTFSKPDYDIKNLPTKNIDEFVSNVAKMKVKRRTWDLP